MDGKSISFMIYDCNNSFIVEACALIAKILAKLLTHTLKIYVGGLLDNTLLILYSKDHI